MPVSVGRSLVIIAAVAGTIFLTRLIPFLFFPKGKEVPHLVRYLGRVLPPAVMGMLVVYCLRGIECAAYALWSAGTDRRGGGAPASCVEAEQFA